MSSVKMQINLSNALFFISNTVPPRSQTYYFSVGHTYSHLHAILQDVHFDKILIAAFQNHIYLFSSVQSLSHVQLFATLCTTAHQASLSITNSWSLSKLISIESVMPSNHLILSRPLLLCLQSFPASGFFPMSQLFASGGQILEFQLQHLLSNEHSRLRSFRMDLVGSPRSPWDSQESCPTPQFKSINSPVLSFLYSPTLTSIHDYWKNHSLDETNLC